MQGGSVNERSLSPNTEQNNVQLCIGGAAALDGAYALRHSPVDTSRSTIGLAMQVRKERRMLMRLDDRALQDIGFDKGRAYGEASRTFWDVPVDRLRC